MNKLIAFVLGGITATAGCAILYGRRIREQGMVVEQPARQEWSHTALDMICNPTVLLFEGMLRSDSSIMQSIQNDDFAQQLADILASQTGELCTRGGEIILRISSDSGRAIVAHLRNRGENFHHFMHGIAPYPLKVDAADVLNALDAIGWRTPTAEERAVFQAVEDLSLRNNREEHTLD